jgi:hypothetical protein
MTTAAAFEPKHEGAHLEALLAVTGTVLWLPIRRFRLAAG